MANEWRLVGFKHPQTKKSLIYLQYMDEEQLFRAIKKGIKEGCNLFSIRGFDKKE